MNKLSTLLFLDSGDPEETQEAINLLGHLDGQTTNPSLVAKNPLLQKKLEDGKLTEEELIEEYRKIIMHINELLPNSSISIEVYADDHTTKSDMVNQALQFNKWIDNAHIKLPSNIQGINAATELTKLGVNVNMTLCFSQQQAGSIYSATNNNNGSSVFVSPFIGRLDDIGLQGMDLIANIQKMYLHGDGHVKLLAASIRNLRQFLYCLYLNVDIITAPIKVYREWAELGKQVPGVDLDKREFEDMGVYLQTKHLKQIPYENISLDLLPEQYSISHELTKKGIEGFSNDWNMLIGR